jgi:hypothetical protein
MYGERKTMKGLTFCQDCKSYHQKYLICPPKRVRLDAEEAVAIANETSTMQMTEPVEEVYTEPTVVEQVTVVDEPVPVEEVVIPIDTCGDCGNEVCSCETVDSETVVEVETESIVEDTPKAPKATKKSSKK